MNIQQLCDRYNIKSRRSLYSRLNGLQITLAKDGNRSYATSEQLALLDEQHEYLSQGGRIDNFEHIPLSVVSTSVDTELMQHNTTIEIIQAIACRMQPIDPLWQLSRLETARVSGWELTTSQVRELIGVTPTGKTYQRGSFTFKRVGKIGKEISWKVYKVTEGERWRV